MWVIFLVGEEYVLIYSEGLKEQHLAYATSSNSMATWADGGQIQIESTKWTRGR